MISILKEKTQNDFDFVFDLLCSDFIKAPVFDFLQGFRCFWCYYFVRTWNNYHDHFPFLNYVKFGLVAADGTVIEGSGSPGGDGVFKLVALLNENISYIEITQNLWVYD